VLNGSDLITLALWIAFGTGGAARGKGVSNMTASPLAHIIIPIVAIIALAAWLAMVFYADAHPGHAGRDAAARQDIASKPDSGDARQQDERPETTSSGNCESSPERQDAEHPGGRSTATPSAPTTM
jgi:hypothetical protein